MPLPGRDRQCPTLAVLVLSLLALALLPVLAGSGPRGGPGDHAGQAWLEVDRTLAELRQPSAGRVDPTDVDAEGGVALLPPSPAGIGPAMALAAMPAVHDAAPCSRPSPFAARAPPPHTA